MKKVYLAGPQVFYPSAKALFEKAKLLCSEHGLVGLSPVDTESANPKEIFNYNKSLIEQADYVVADMNSFRGSEPDSGTCWEVGYAFALNKHVFTYVNTAASVLEKTARYFGLDPSTVSGQTVMSDGMYAEDLDGCLNLMLSESSTIVFGGLGKALDAIRLHAYKPKWEPGQEVQ